VKRLILESVVERLEEGKINTLHEAVVDPNLFKEVTLKKVFVAIVAVAGALAAPTAHASDYGCKVLLCLANPNGPRAVSECVPPINQLFHDLARGRSFPTCDLASAPDNSGGRSWAQQGMSYYDPCPEGTTALPSGSYAVQGTATPMPRYPWGNSGDALYTGIGDGDGLMPGSGVGDGYSPLPGKVCVGSKIGDTYVSMGSGDSYSAVSAGVYDRVVMLDAQGSPRIIDVFVNSSLYRRVRW
jgi:hypothetical protein